MHNIYNFLKPRGVCLLTIVVDHPVFNIFKELSGDERYKSLMTDVGNFYSTNYFEENPIQTFKSHLKDVGFQKYHVEVKDIFTFYKNGNAFVGI
jgi:hypothetical protein